MTAIGAAGHVEAASPTCSVRNVTTARTYGPGDGWVLKRALTASRDRDVLQVRGRCVGNYSVETDVTLTGRDRRGVTRPQGPACDMGAYELRR